MQANESLLFCLVAICAKLEMLREKQELAKPIPVCVKDGRQEKKKKKKKNGADWIFFYGLMRLEFESRNKQPTRKH